MDAHGIDVFQILDAVLTGSIVVLAPFLGQVICGPLAEIQGHVDFRQCVGTSGQIDG